jgi:hypothetical protein
MSALNDFIKRINEQIRDLKYKIRGGQPKPPIESFDFGGALISGYAKGWIFDSPSRKVIVVCSHSNADVNTQVAASKEGVPETRKIIWKKRLILPMFAGVAPNPKSPEHLFASDIIVAVVDNPFPEEIKRYKVAQKFKQGDWVCSMHSNNAKSLARGLIRDDRAVIARKIGSGFWYGDSGLPWLDISNNVVSHTVLGGGGFGPLYCHPMIKNAVLKALEEAEKFAQNH